MKWIKIEDELNPRAQLPKDKVFYAIWKGAFCIAQYDEEEDGFYIAYLPADMEFRSKHPMSKESEYKFYYYCIPTYPDEWLDTSKS